MGVGEDLDAARSVHPAIRSAAGVAGSVNVPSPQYRRRWTVVLEQRADHMIVGVVQLKTDDPVKRYGCEFVGSTPPD